MALNIKNSEVELVAAEVAALTHESKTEAIRKALFERKQKLVERRRPSGGGARVLQLLERAVWPQAPKNVAPIYKEEEAEILGYGPDGV